MPFINLKYPLQIGNQGYFATNDTLEDSTKENIKHVLLTNKGERVMQPEYGSDIVKMLFEPLTSQNKAKISSLASEAINRWVPSAKLINVIVRTKEDLSVQNLNLVPIDTHTVLVTIVYAVKLSVNVITQPTTINLVIKP